MLPQTQSHRGGTVLVWVALCLVALLGMVAFALDGGRLMHERRSAQAAADAAALAAAGELFRNGPSATAAAAAVAMATANGYTETAAHGKPPTHVTVHIPPSSGTFAGRSGYAEVIVWRQLPAGIAIVLGQQHLDVEVRAVARGLHSAEVQGGVYCLGAKGSDGLTVFSAGSLEVVGSPVYVNTTAPNTVLVQDKATLIAGSLAVGGDRVNDQGTIQLDQPPIQYQAPPQADPLAHLPAPSPANYPDQSATRLTVGSANSPMVIQPGVYHEGIEVQKGGVVTLQPGVYLIDDGGFTVRGGGTVRGTGVMIYNTKFSNPKGAGAILVERNCEVTLAPPTTGTYSGITFFQSRTAKSSVTFNGNENVYGRAKRITGCIYGVAAPVELGAQGTSHGGAGKDVLAGSIICNKLEVRDANSGFVQINPQAATRALRSEYGLVE